MGCSGVCVKRRHQLIRCLAQAPLQQRVQIANYADDVDEMKQRKAIPCIGSVPSALSAVKGIQKWRISFVCNAERSFPRRSSRPYTVRFARMNGNFSAIAGRNGPRLNVWQQIIETVSKKKRRDFWALAPSPNLLSASALCLCNRRLEICSGIASRCLTIEPSRRSTRAAGSVRSRYRIRITTPR